jgi:predicted NUDIX family phosphoesterase
MGKNDEQILVIKAEIIFKDGIWQGLKRDNLDYYLDLINKNYEFKRRGDVEEDNSYQQIIPYIVFNYEDKYFIYKYLESAGEKRLVNHCQLGVGGHINKEDINGDKNVLETGMMREWEEEVDFKGNLLQRKLVGILNDDSTSVEKVHLGLVYNFTGDSPEISVKETDKMKGELVDFKNLEEYIKNAKGIWARIVYNEYLKKIKLKWR